MKQVLIKLKVLLRYNFIYWIILIISFSFSYYQIIKPESLPRENYIKGYVKETKSNYILVNNSIIYLDENFYKIDDYVYFEGTYEEIKKETNINLFDYKKYYKSIKIYNIFEIKEVIYHKNIKSIRSNIYEYTKKIDNKFLPLLLFAVNDDVDLSTYQNNGVIHLFSISGMHMTILTNILYFILKNKKLKQNMVVLLVLYFYMYLTNFKIGVLRSFLLILFTFINNLFNLKIKKTNIFILTTTIPILYNPFIILNIGFQFSYIISFFLLKFATKEDYFISLLKTSIMCFFVSAPLIIYHYFSINIMSILSNIIFIPLVFLLYIIAIISLFINNAHIFNLLMDYLNKISLYLNNYTIDINFVKPSLIIVFIYYFLIYLILKKNYKYIYILLIITLIHFNYRSLAIHPEVHMIDASQGDSLIYTHKNNNIVIDVGTNKTLPYIKSLGINKIDYLIITHGDLDHIKGAINLVNKIKINKVIFNCGEYNDLEQELIQVLNKKKIPYYSCIKELNIDDNKLYFLNNKDYGNENDNSSVIYTELNNYKFLFMGDAGVEVEEDLIEKYNLKDIDVLKVGHHGSRTSSGKEFINEIKPKYSIISVGKNNRYGHPNKEVLDNLKDSKIYRTDIDGSVMFKINKDELKIKTCMP